MHHHYYLPFDAARPESCITDINPMLPVPDHMRTMFRNLHECGDAPCVEATLWILHAATLANHDLNVWECERLLCSVMRGMCVGTPFCGAAFPHMCLFEREERATRGKLFETKPKPNVGARAIDQTVPNPSYLGTIAEELVGALQGVRTSGGLDGIRSNNPLNRLAHNSVEVACAVVSKLYDVILLSHICASTGRPCTPMAPADNAPVQSFVVFRMQPLCSAQQNTCESLCLSLTSCGDLTHAMRTLTHTDRSPQPDALLMPSIVHMQRVLSSVALQRRMKRPISGACRSMRDILMNHWSLYCSLYFRHTDAQSLFADDFCEHLTPPQLTALKKFAAQALELADSNHQVFFAQCLERRITLTEPQREWMMDIINGLHELLTNFVTTMHSHSLKLEHEPGPLGYMSYMMTPSLWCYTHRFSVSDRRQFYEEQVSEYMDRCQELGKRWSPQPHLYDVRSEEWEDKFSNFVSNMLEFTCPLLDCCPPVLDVLGDNNPPVHGRWLLRLSVYNPAANKTHIVDVPLNVALRLARVKVVAYFRGKGMDVPRSLKNVASTVAPTASFSVVPEWPRPMDEENF